ncbi:MAG: MFS transporter [Acidimicrobiia bacterium]
MTSRSGPSVQLGLRENLPQFLLLVAVNALVGGMVGQERTVVPLLAEAEFDIAAHAAVLSFIAVFGVSKALVNYFAGRLADRFGRKPVLVAGWLIGLPVPLLLIWAPTWGWVLLANALLGINQGLTWSVTVIMKIDLVGPRLRGTAMGFNEAAGYAAVAVTAWATGAIAEIAGLRPAPFLLGLAFAALGLGLSTLLVRDTSGHVTHEATTHSGSHGGELTPGQVFALTTWRDRSLSSACQAGLVNNLNEGMAWGLFPLLYAAAELDLSTVGALIAIAPAVWGVGQLFTGALSDRIGRKWLIVVGQLNQATGLLIIALGGSVGYWAAGSVLFGAGTAMAYPTLIAVVGDVAHPVWRGAAVGVYRLWRDMGFAAGAVIAGFVADLYTTSTAIVVVAAITAASGLEVAFHMRETLPPMDQAP